MLEPVKIIQLSSFRTGSTVLTNLLYGFFTPSAPVAVYGTHIEQLPPLLETHDIIKTHDIHDIDRIISTVRGAGYIPYFVCSERPALNIVFPDHIRARKDFLIVPYVYLNVTHDYTVEDMAKRVLARLQGFLPDDVVRRANWWMAACRINNMNARYTEIAEKPFEYYDPFFHIHGHHRNRGPNHAGA